MKKLVLASAVLVACLSATSANAFNNGFTVGAVGGFAKSSGDLSNLNSDSDIGGARYSKRYDDKDLSCLANTTSIIILHLVLHMISFILVELKDQAPSQMVVILFINQQNMAYVPTFLSFTVKARYS